MKEKLIIKNFGPIKSVELDLGRFNILIGEQATGKSTIAKVLAVCRYFSYIVTDENELNDDPFFEGLTAWGLEEYIQDDSTIYYDCKNYSINAKFVTAFYHNNDTNMMEPIDVFKVILKRSSTEFEYLLNEFYNIKNDFSFVDWRAPIGFFQNDVSKVMDNPFYSPVERGLQSIFSIGKNSIQNVSDSLFNQFAKMDGIARQFKKDTFIEPLNLYYQNRDGHGFIRKVNETEYYSLANAASGYQSTIPVVLVIKYYNELKKRKKTFLIEEPELNLFPNAQNKLMQYIVDMSNKYGNTILLTTQSPYTLTSLNNLMYAYQVGQVHPEKVSKEIEKKYWLNPEDVSAYMMKPDGTCEDIRDDDGLIKAEKIDEVSKTINKKFNNIMDIELGVDEEAK